MNPRNEVSPANSDEDSDHSDDTISGGGSIVSGAGTTSPVLTRRERPSLPVPPSISPYSYADSKTYSEALRKYNEDLRQFHLDLSKYEEEELLLLAKTTAPLLPEDSDFKPRNYVGGIDFSHNALSDRHLVTIDDEGRIQICSRGNVSTYDDNQCIYYGEVGPFSFTLKKKPVNHTWGYWIDFDSRNFYPIVQTQLDSKDRIKIVIGAQIEGNWPEMDEICFHLINSKQPVQLDDIFIRREMYDKSLTIIVPF